MENGYKNRDELIKYDLDIKLFEEFKLKVKDIIPVRNIFVIRTDAGDKILKRVDYSIEDLMFIYKGVRYIKNSFDRIFDFVENKDGGIFVNWNKDVYYLMDLISGRECEFANNLDLKIAAKGLGELHKASEGFHTDRVNKIQSGRLIDNFKRMLEEMNFFKNIVNMYESKSEFDELFVKNVDYYVDKINESIEILKSTQYFKLCSEEDKIVLCHHDLAHHNILIQKDEAYFVDFDYSILDLKVHDLCNLIIKAIKNYSFDMEKCRVILDGYSLNNSLDKRELEVLYGMLYFPMDFYAISKDYYTRRKKWEEEVFIYRMKRKLDYREDVEEFLKEFKKNYL